MKKIITVLPGDGVGPEVVSEAVKILVKIGEKYNHDFNFSYGLIGHAAIEKTGVPLPPETKSLCKSSDAILFGAIGDPRYDNDPSAKIRPEQGLLELRKLLGLFANIRPIQTFKPLLDKSPLKPAIVENADFIVIRELIGGIYFGEPRGRSENGTLAFDTCVYSKNDIMRVSRFAFELAQKRKNKITLVDKANVLETSRLWRETVKELALSYPKVNLDFMFIDNASMQIIKKPGDFDIILTENMFGDILTDEASVITGSIGMLPSASIGEKISLFEPIHGSYPKAAGKNSANPIGTILSLAMMLDYSFGLKKESTAVYDAVKNILDQGFGTKDIVSKNPLTTNELGDRIASSIF